MPQGKKHQVIFQTILMMGTIPATSTINWLAHTSNLSWDAFFQNFSLYPLFLALAIGVRFFIANPLINPLIKRFIVPRFKGIRRSLSITLVNVLAMGTLIALFRTLMTAGNPSEILWGTFASSLPLSYLISFVFGYFIASPLTKKLYARIIEPSLNALFKRIDAKNHELLAQGRLIRWIDNLGGALFNHLSTQRLPAPRPDIFKRVRAFSARTLLPAKS